MKTHLYHLQINVSDAAKSLPFYKNLFASLNYKITDESAEHVGVSNGTTDFWIIATEEDYIKNGFNRKNTGLNHLAFRVESKKMVDDFTAGFLKKHSVSALYGTPKTFPEYRPDYYAVYFEDPDRIKLEVVYIPEQ